MSKERTAPARAHLGWIDAAKGLIIVLVVVLYACEWAQSDEGSHIWLQHLVDFAAPFRMPAFFLISGLLLSSTIGRDWRTYFDRKVLHFAYFYVLWLAILIAFEAPWIAREEGALEVPQLYLESLVRPYSMLWFIYLLPIFFVVTRLLRAAPASIVWTIAAALQVADPEAGIKVLDKFCHYYVFFYSGYLFAPKVCALARGAAGHRAVAAGGFLVWLLLNAWLVEAGIALAPGIGLLAGLLGAMAIIAGCVLIARTRVDAALAYCGRNSLVIYLGFYIPLVITGMVVSDWIGEASTALLSATAGVLAPLLLHRLVRGGRLSFLFERPRWFSADAAATAFARFPGRLPSRRTADRP